MTMRFPTSRRWIQVVLTAAIAISVIGGVVWFLWAWLGPASPPQTQAAVERELERPVLDYDLVDGTGYVTFISADTVHVDKLIIGRHLGILDRQWQWSGMWLATPASNDPATAAMGALDGHTVIFGLINDESIVSIEIELDGEWQSHAVVAPGYAVFLDPGIAPASLVLFRDASGVLVTESTLLRSTVDRVDGVAVVPCHTVSRTGTCRLA